MPTVITGREAEALVLKGELPPPDAILTPSARDVLRGRGVAVPAVAAGTAKPGHPSKAPATPDLEFKWKPGTDPVKPADIEKFFNSPEIHVLKECICEIGRRLWQREYVDGNGGNITIRVGDNLALCTPTLISKGFMKPADLCLVDLDGKQLAGTRVRTSEALTHLGIMKRQPAAKACIHAHPPHAFAFSISNTAIPTCLSPEAEVFLGKIGLAKYATPGTPENAEEVGRVGVDHQVVLMQNHGIIIWSKDVEDVYWKVENLDAYCRTVWIAAGLGSGLHRFSGAQAKELVRLRQKLGMPESRTDLKECELCDSGEFRPGVVCAAPAAERSAPAESADPGIEALVRQITDQLLKQLSA